LANRVAFLVDGFNLYHSIRDVSRRNNVNCRWLDIAALCGSFLPDIGRDATFASAHYFSALATHAEAWRPGTVKRHLTYIDALRSTGVIVELSTFKAKPMTVRCQACGSMQKVIRHEEKETDVAIGAKLIELAIGVDADSIVVVTGDTDLVPAVRTARAFGCPSASSCRTAAQYRDLASGARGIAPLNESRGPCGPLELHYLPGTTEQGSDN
jgi:uncharacterized LabA/DUF88 family protein